METEQAFAWPEGWETAIPAVTRLVLSICRRQELRGSEVDDVIQDTLVRLTIEAESRKRHFASLPELCGWVSWYVRSLLSRRRRRQSLEAVANGVCQPNSPDANVETPGIEDITVYFSILEPREQDVLTLRYVEGLGFEKIAERLGFSAAQAHKLHKRSIEKLRRRLST